MTDAQTRCAWATLDEFFEALKAAPSRALLLDYDGTLAPFRVERNEATPYPGVRERLQRILGGGRTRLVFITGRRVKNLIPLLELEPVPEIWGSHGWERRLANGTLRVHPMDPADQEAVDRLIGFATAQGWRARCEHKPGGLTFHLRGVPLEDAERIQEELLAHAPALIAGSALQIREFQGGVEFYLPERNKGLALQTVLDECPDGCVSAFLGDDATDEDAFLAIRGRGAGILVAPERRPSAARFWIRPPEELLAFLDRWAALETRG